MKLGPITKLDKENKKMSKNFDNDIISAKCDVIVIFPIFDQFGAIRKPFHFHRTFSSTIIFYFIKTENRTKKSLTQISHYYFE